MAVVYSENVVEIAVVQSYGGKELVNVWHMRDDDVIAEQAFEDLVTDFATNWQQHVLDAQSNALTVVRFDWRSLDPNDSALGSLAPVAGQPSAGSVAGAGSPPNVAMLLHKNTSNRPRGRKDGRSYLGGVPEAYVNDNGALNGTTAAVINGYLTSFYNGISDTGVWNTTEHYPVVLETTVASRTPGNAAVTIGSRRITSITCDPISATQRERLRR